MRIKLSRGQARDAYLQVVPPNHTAHAVSTHSLTACLLPCACPGATHLGGGAGFPHKQAWRHPGVGLQGAAVHVQPSRLGSILLQGLAGRWPARQAGQGRAGLVGIMCELCRFAGGCQWWNDSAVLHRWKEAVQERQSSWCILTPRHPKLPAPTFPWAVGRPTPRPHSPTAPCQTPWQPRASCSAC